MGDKQLMTEGNIRDPRISRTQKGGGSKMWVSALGIKDRNLEPNTM